MAVLISGRDAFWTYLQFYWNNSSLVPFLTRTRNPAFAPFCSKRLMHYNNLLNIFNFPDFLALRFALFFQSRELRTDTSSCEQPSKCVSPQGPTEGCGVIPVKGRRMCTDPDPGGILLIFRFAFVNFVRSSLIGSKARYH